MADSRGSTLQQEIINQLRRQNLELSTEIDVTVRTMEGASLDNIVRKMNHKYPDPPRCDVLYIHAGVNNLTNKSGRIIQPVYDNIPELVEDITDKITELKTKLVKICQHIVVVQLVGLDLSRYNREIDDGFWFYQQNVINDAMPLLAHTINFINKADDLVGPWLTGTVHDYVNKKLYNRYGKLVDGLHPTSQTQTKWANLFGKSIYISTMTRCISIK